MLVCVYCVSVYVTQCVCARSDYGCVCIIGYGKYYSASCVCVFSAHAMLLPIFGMCV